LQKLRSYVKIKKNYGQVTPSEKRKDFAMYTISLNGKWTVKNALTGEVYAATVPGDIHHDLLEANVIPNPYYSDNANACGWVTEQDWIYEKKFEVTEEMLKNRLSLVFAGIDTYSEIFVNGKSIGSTDNMFLRYAYTINDFVSVGENTLTIRLISIKEAAKQFPDKGYFGCFNVQRIFMRKAQCHFSWDWAPNFPAMGIWQGVSIEVCNGSEISKVMIHPYLDGRASFFIHMTKDFDNYHVDGKFLRIKVWDGEQTVIKTFPVEGIKNAYNLFIENAKLWWPVGMGEAHLYNYEVTLIEDGVETYAKSGRFGFRTVELDQSPIDEGKFACQFKINGEKVFLKGANWVPLDIMTGAIAEEKYRKAIDIALDANYNCLRVWGGGIYEKDIFFDTCDEKGMLVWQDFQLACADIPDDYPGFADRMIEEAEYQISRLQCHPSFFVTTGGNEKTGAFGKAKSRGDRLVYYTLRGLCDHIDGTRPYMPSSPYSFTDSGNDFGSGDTHTNSYQSSRASKQLHDFREVLKNLDASLASEVGLQGSCRVEALKKYIPEDKLWPVNDIYDLHFTRNPYDGTGTTFVEQQMEAAEILFGSFDGLNEFVKKSMALHSEFVKADSEFHRARRARCGGAMFWMFSDIWPSGTWAIVDYYLIPKAAYYASKRAFKPVTPIITKIKETVGLYVVNDTLSDVSGVLTLKYTDVDGNIHAIKTINVTARANASTFVEALDGMIEYGTQHILVAEFDANNEKTKTFYYPDLWKDVQWKEPELDVKIERCCDKCATITITAKSAFARMVNILTPDLANTSFSDNFFDMEKGETRVITVKAAEAFDTADIAVKTWLDEWDR